MYEQNISKMLSLKPMINVKTLKSWKCVKKALKHCEKHFCVQIYSTKSTLYSTIMK